MLKNNQGKGLNNFKVNSIFDYGSQSCFGFKENEVKQMLGDYQMSECFDEVKEWYDGYLFGDVEIYTLWSTLMYMDRKLQNRNATDMSFWANTSGNELDVNYIKQADDFMYDEFETLMQGQSIDKYVNLELAYRDMDDIDNIYNFLLMTEYLKAVKEISYSTYELVIPNREVYEIYKQSFMKYFQAYTHSRKRELINALLEEDVIKAEKLLNDILFKDMSYYNNQESFYHGFLVGLLQEYGTESNREKGEGRTDIVIRSRRESRKAIVFECKHSDSKIDILNDSIAGEKQIKDRKYIEGIQASEQRETVGYGIAFYKKRCKITIAK